MKKIIPVLLALSGTQFLSAQSFNFSPKNEWKAKPAVHSTNGMFDTSAAVGIFNDKHIEYRAEKDDIFMYITTHLLTKVKDDKGIEMYNKIYLYMPPNSQLTAFKARAVSASGTVTNVDSASIKEIDEEGSKYKLFAVNGVEKGSEIEYQYTLKRYFSIFNSEVFQNKNVPYLEENFTLVTPAYLRFNAKGYNGFDVSADSVMGDKRYIVGMAKNVKELDDEKYAYSGPYLQHVDYKLSYNMNKDSTARMYTWKEFAKKAYSTYTERGEKENKAVDNLLKSIKMGDATTDAAKISVTEDYIKSNINVDENLIAEDASNLERTLKTKATDERGIVRLFAALYDKLGINYSIVFPSNRSKFPFDEDLENWNRADDILLYFPSLKRYMAPASVVLRYPYVPSELTGSRGLFLKGTTIGNFTSAVGTFAKVEPIPFEDHAQNMEADIRFNKEMDSVLIHSRQILKGYGAVSYRPIYAYAPKDKQEEFSKQIVQSIGGTTTDVKNLLVENKELKDCFDNKPLIISADIACADLLENAGKKVLFKLGDVIGPQEEMYQEKPRQLPIELPYAHVLMRKLTLHIPDGYTVKNLGDINFNILQKQAGEDVAGFVSSYTQSGNTVEVNINEFYKKISYPIESFEDYRKVINASADFNKVVLVLEQKG